MTLSELKIETQDEIVYADLSGDIDMSNVQQIRSELGLAVTNQVVGLVLNLTEVDYLDSAGMHLVHSLRANLRAHGQKLALVIPPGSVINDALRLAGIDWDGELISSSAEAPEAFGLEPPTPESPTPESPAPESPTPESPVPESPAPQAPGATSTAG